MRRLILSFFGTGYLRPAPGTWGSFAALPAAWAIHTLAGPYALLILAALLYALGVYLTAAETAQADDHDPSWIVIDEVVGQWIALLPVAFGASRFGLDMLRLWPGVLAAFLLFRLFDIWKPWLVGRADRRGDATGVMLDDVWAGIFAAIGVSLLALLAHAGLAGSVAERP
ncbi:MAG: phosphatidylglycerophosphatase A [Silicimonas sp.]|nr:phosphatidylglycerophosphatase A [Silicimonas sp.]NND20107.1 phosphatidylglycerophosphatase A [Silicimonas sp.]NNF90439.1 phosphatidylglycerophosphatase A [Boseongicola sp.]